MILQVAKRIANIRFDKNTLILLYLQQIFCCNVVIIPSNSFKDQ